MKHWINWLATILAVGAALMTGLIGAWRELPLLTLALRCLVAAVLVYGFVRATGEVAGKMLLHDLAERELEQEEKSTQAEAAPEDESEQQAA